MSLLSIASNASAWRGYEYYIGKKVISYQQTDEYRIEGEVSGSKDEPYRVMIDLEHPTKSTCNCPLAAGKRIVCKHKVALFFSVFPNEAQRYITEIEEYEREEERQQQERFDEIVKYVMRLSKKELQTELINMLAESEEQDDDRFW